MSVSVSTILRKIMAYGIASGFPMLLKFISLASLVSFLIFKQSDESYDMSSILFPFRLLDFVISYVGFLHFILV